MFSVNIWNKANRKQLQLIKHNQAANLAYRITQYGLLVGFIHPLFVFFPHLQKFFLMTAFFLEKDETLRQDYPT